MCRCFWVSFSELLYFCVGFFNSPMPFLGRFYQYLHILLLYIMYVIRKSNSVLGTKFSFGFCILGPTF